MGAVPACLKEERATPCGWDAPSSAPAWIVRRSECRAPGCRSACRRPGGRGYLVPGECSGSDVPGCRQRELAVTRAEVEERPQVTCVCRLGVHGTRAIQTEKYLFKATPYPQDPAQGAAVACRG